VSFELSVRLPVQIELDYTEPFFDAEINTLQIKVTPMDLDDVEEFTCARGHPAEVKEPRTQYDEGRIHREKW